MRWQLPLFAVLVSGPSMAPVLHHGDALIVRRGATVRTGDIVVARFRSRPGLLVVKRVVREQDGGWWLEGDNTFVQDDSRSYGVADVIGRVLFRYYPGPWRLS
ncbi:S26 family signal peptidase [Actinoplanes awajinensis]|uniref:Phage repressor protein n=1 Tax=Actinoplanes awajinensis subsp. mycoplanecinus TaxID=135947 RepID=A0A101JMC0_9ACTN|nr:S26 family signal peptidase [Actinoplanes awajinensis]KUL29533.1 phage repressor protein [Actinoplanes awajinensis subsp. mycoplanecinus]